MTHIVVRGDVPLDSDAVLGVKQSLVTDFTRQSAGTPTPDGQVLDGTGRGRASTSCAPADT
ncbi:hypothetical protein [Streptomyces sp. NPDC088801]|uniref:hypothetical protein n=1 Tax=Streptomyces sp. NPDC088801 TaxID=3365903 RepID=UPI00382BF89B